MPSGNNKNERFSIIPPRGNNKYANNSSGYFRPPNSLHMNFLPDLFCLLQKLKSHIVAVTTL